EHIGRAEQDSYAARSQDRYARAKADGFFAGEIQAVHNGKELVSEDEHPRADTNIQKLGKLKPAFKDGGTVTAGNSSGINDGAAALLIAAREKAESLGLRALGRVVGAPRGRPPARARAPPWPLRHRHDVHRGRPGPRDALRTGVLSGAILTPV